MTKISCVDLFCGAGGLTHGFVLEKIPVVAGVDVDPACRFPYEANNNAKFIEKDVSELSTKDIKDLFANSDFKILAGCAPCQPFSTYSQRYGHDGVDGKWGLLYEFARIAQGTKPDVITMENVPTVAKHKVFDDFVQTLKNYGYFVTFGVVNCSEYDVPQIRKRMVLLASRHGPIEMIPPTSQTPKTVREAIANLPKLNAGEAHPNDKLHISSKLSDKNIERIKASKPGGTWRDWPEHLIADCHKAETGITYPSVYGRMEWDKPAPTMTTQCFGFGNGRFGHPEQNRAISLREAAIIQSFPNDYKFVQNDDESIAIRTIGRLIGNAVPVNLGRAIAKSIKNHLKTL